VDTIMNARSKPMTKKQTLEERSAQVAQEVVQQLLRGKGEQRMLSLTDH
jgi:hypothetical protein